MKTPIDETRPGWGRARTATTFALVAAVVAVLAVPAGLQPADASPACPAGGPIAAASLPPAVRQADCDLRGRTIADGPAGAVVPAPGTGVRSSATTATGTHSLVLETQSDGTVLINPAPELGVAAAAGETGSSDDLRAGSIRTAANPCKGCPPACKDNAYAYYAQSFHWDMSEGIPFPWYFKRSSTPRGLSADAAMKAFINATNNIATSRNNCNLADLVNLTVEFKGDTTKSANINSGGCTPPDGTSVIDFGLNLAPGQTCSWYFVIPGLDDLVESDIRMLSTTNWTTTVGKACTNKFDLGGLATHERGHSFGLAHPDTPTFAIHGNLTMSTYGLNACSKSYRTFGKGDVLGLRELYP